MDWSRYAHAYDWQLPLERAALAAAVDLGRPQADHAWLDVGTGTAGLLRELAGRPDRPAVAIGVDASTAMLERAPALPRGWELKVGKGQRLRFGDGAFSVVTAAYLLHVVDGLARREILAEARRVVHTGGRFVSVTPAWPRRRLAAGAYAVLVRAAGRRGPNQNPLAPLDPRAELRAAGFDVEAARYVGRGYPSLCVSATRAS